MQYRDNSADWLFFAESDLKTAKVMLRERIYHMACFHAQQTVEKSFKALLRHEDKIVPKTHSLSKLLFEIKKLGFKWLKEDKITFVDQFYSPTRYPDTLPGSLPGGLPTKTDAENAVKIADEVYSQISEEVIS